MQWLSTVVKRARRTVETEGWRSLIGRAWALVATWFLVYRTYYLSAYDLETLPAVNEDDVRPNIDGLTVVVVTSNHEADELEARGFEFRSYPFFVNARKALDAGAIAVCVFVGQELGTIGWEAVTQQAMDVFDEPPIRVDFAHGESFSSGTWTNPKYRRMGLRAYRTWKKRSLLARQGVTTARGYARTNNVALLMGLLKFNATFRSQGRYLKVLWWKSWRETPLPPGWEPPTPSPRRRGP